MLIILARMSKRIGRADMIEFGKHYLRRFQSMNMLKNGVPSEATLCRIENDVDSMELAGKMAEFHIISRYIRVFNAMAFAFYDTLIYLCSR
jgi:hypothetical protein